MLTGEKELFPIKMERAGTISDLYKNVATHLRCSQGKVALSFEGENLVGRKSSTVLSLLEDSDSEADDDGDGPMEIQIECKQNT